MQGKKIVFVSHKNTKLSNAVGETIKQTLDAAGYDTFLDDVNLEAGDAWEKKILDNLWKSSVLIVLLDEQTVESDWVQREVDMARGANIRILPLLVTEQENAVSVIQRLNLSSIQFKHWEAGKTASELPDIIHRLASETRADQRQWIRDWASRSHPHLHPEARKRTATYTHPKTPGISYHLAQGSATEIRGYEVLVNTENNFMQMARAYELNTLSSSIRHQGAEMRGGLMIADTVQDELWQQIRNSPNFFGLPLQLGEVVATSPGHPDSELTDAGYRYIFHAAAVEIDKDSRQINPPRAATIPRVLTNCLRKAAEIDANKGAVLWVAPNQLEEGDSDHEPLRSILFPVFGAGEGTGKFNQAIEAIATGLIAVIPREMKRKPAPSIEEIGLCIYNPSDLPRTRAIFEEAGFERQ